MLDKHNSHNLKESDMVVTSKMDDLMTTKLQNDNSLGQLGGPNSQFSTGDLVIDQDRPSTE